MDVRLQRAIDRWVGVPACAALSLGHAIAARPTPPLPPKPRILVILLSEMGSLVLAEPLFRRIDERWPGAEVHMLLFKRNRALLDLLGVVPPERIHVLRDTSATDLASDLWATIRRIRSLDFHATIDCELFARVSAILSGLSGAPRRAGFHRHTQEGLYRGSFLTDPVLYNPYRHLSHQLVTLVDALASGSSPRAKEFTQPAAFTPPEFTPEPGELEREVGQLHTDFPALRGQRLALVYPSGGLLAIRAWPEPHYVELVRGLRGDGLAVGLIGMPDDRTLNERIRAAAGGGDRCVNLAGYTRSVRHLITLFRRASLLVTNDGGPGQFAALTPLPTIVFFGPETPALYRSWSPHAFAFHEPLPCSPCLTAYNHRQSPCDGDNQCLKRIRPEAVLAKAREMLPTARPVEIDR
jgi:ADP-heptose:LPS heptosyltransferase